MCLIQENTFSMRHIQDHILSIWSIQQSAIAREAHENAMAEEALGKTQE